MHAWYETEYEQRERNPEHSIPAFCPEKDSKPAKIAYSGRKKEYLAQKQNQISPQYIVEREI